MDDGFAAASCKKNIGDKPQRQFVRVDCLISVNEKKMEPSVKNVKKKNLKILLIVANLPQIGQICG